MVAAGRRAVVAAVGYPAVVAAAGRRSGVTVVPGRRYGVRPLCLDKAPLRGEVDAAGAPFCRASTMSIAPMPIP